MRTSLLALVVVALAGCASNRAPAAPTAADLGLNPSALSANATIVENAVSQPQLSTLVSLVQQAGLVETLSGTGPFTVFAPVNSAFEGVDASGLTDEQIAGILTYHVVAGNLSAGDISDGMTLETVQGGTVTLSVGDGVMVENANVVFADIEASNGTIHLIDAVLMP
ncbi:MAG: fasciclin domain-containing protein [Bacteroidota bacterium]